MGLSYCLIIGMRPRFLYNEVNNSVNVDYTTNTISLTEWNNVLEENGAIFLPAAGRYSGWGYLYGTGTDGYYWSSERYLSNVSKAYALLFSKTSHVWSSYQDKYQGYSVRLVQDVQ